MNGFDVGDTVQVVHAALLNNPLNGLRCRVLEYDSASNYCLVKPLTERADGYGTNPFYWPAFGLRPV